MSLLDPVQLQYYLYGVVPVFQTVIPLNLKNKPFNFPTFSELNGLELPPFDRLGPRVVPMIVPPLFINMLRRYGKRRPFTKRNKYSVEQTSFSLVLPTITDNNKNTLEAQNSINIVPPTEVQGMRKVKNITVSLCAADGASTDRSFYYAIVYVPQGYNVGILRTPDTNQAFNMYEANQFVITSGVIDLSAGPQRIFTRLSRNLNSGDNIYMILKQGWKDTQAYSIAGVITYAVTLQ